MFQVLTIIVLWYRPLLKACDALYFSAKNDESKDNNCNYIAVMSVLLVTTVSLCMLLQICYKFYMFMLYHVCENVFVIEI